MAETFSKTADADYAWVVVSCGQRIAAAMADWAEDATARHGCDGVNHLIRYVLLGEKDQFAAGRLGALGHVVVLE